MSESLFIEVQQRNAAYAHAIDSGDLKAWVALFTEDALYLAQPRENADRGLPLATIRCEGQGMLLDRVMAIEETMVYTPRYVRHILSVPHITAGEPVVQSITAFAIYQTQPGRPTILFSVGEYRDQWVRGADSVLRLKERIAVFDTELVPNSMVYPL
jgi:3-phenylpropionate/cinnamic acid dioxygenase small subunit